MSDKTVLGALDEFVDVHEDEEHVTSPVHPAGEPSIVRLTDYRDDWVNVPDRVITKIPGNSDAQRGLCNTLQFNCKSHTQFRWID